MVPNPPRPITEIHNDDEDDGSFLNKQQTCPRDVLEPNWRGVLHGVLV